MTQDILVLATHPDDEVLGCGGTLLIEKARGNRIHWLIMTTMTSEAGFSAGAIEAREKEIQEVASQMRFDSVANLRLPATGLSEIPDSDLVRKISEVISAVRPSVVVLPFRGDVHSDHRRVFDAGFSCTKVFRFPSVRQVLMMETLSETEFAPAIPGEAFVPNLYYDISHQIDQKIAILKCFQGELGSSPFPRSEEKIRALAAYRGTVAGTQYAEAFMMLRELR